MNVRIKKDMGLGMLMLAGLFLFNPIVGFIDVLPDCVGFLLICGGIGLFADLNEQIASAQKRFQILFWGSVLQVFSELLIYRFLKGRQEEMNPYELPVTVLLFSFILFVFYLIVLIPAFRDLFMGLERLGERFDFSFGEKKARKKGRGESKSASERLCTLTAVFTVALVALNLLPEFSILTSFEHDIQNPLFTFDWYKFIGLFRGACGILAACFSIPWLIVYLRYFAALKKDKLWIDRLKNHYTETILSQTEMLSLRRIRFSFLILFVAIFFAIPLRMNYISILPCVVLAFLVFAAILLLGDLLREQKRLYLSAGVLAIVSAAQLIVNSFYLKYYIPTDSLFYPNAFWHYLFVQLLDIGEAAATVWLIYELLHTLMETVRSYTGVDYGKGNGEALASRATQKLQRSFCIRYNVTFVLFFVSGVGTVVDTVFHLSLGWLWLFPLCASIAGVFCFYSVQHDLLEEIGYYFQPDQMHKREG